jgi:hypothetical protein
MTVRELIEVLITYAPDDPVYRGDHEWGPRPVQRVVLACPPNDPLTDEVYSPGVVIE